jgi:hypothetical protein
MIIHTFVSFGFNIISEGSKKKQASDFSTLSSKKQKLISASIGDALATDIDS